MAGDFVFELPSLMERDEDTHISPVFDFETGEFVLDGRGDVKMTGSAGACEAWCGKALSIERYALLSYSRNMGVELMQVDLYTSREARESCIKRVIEEALLADPHGRVSHVDGFVFKYPEPDEVEAAFTVHLKSGLQFDMKKEISNG